MNPARAVINAGRLRVDPPVGAPDASVEAALESAARLGALTHSANVPALAERLQQGRGDTTMAKDLFPLMAGLLVHVLALDRHLVREAMTRRSR